jgi:transposase
MTVAARAAFRQFTHLGRCHRVRHHCPSRSKALTGSLGADRRDLWAGKHATTGHNFLVIADLLGLVRYVSDPRPGKDHDMTLVKEETVARILAAAGDVIADKGFQGSGYITPVKKPAGGELTWLQHDYNNKLSGLRAAVERAVAHIKNWRILHTDYRRPIETGSTDASVGMVTAW